MEMRVTALTWQAEDVITVTLTTIDGTPVPAWEAGAHVDLHLPTGTRQYSLCGNPTDQSLTVGVLRTPDSRGGSQFIHDDLRVGSALTVSGPRNNFELVDSEEYLFIAGGIGITPLLPMIAEAERRHADWKLAYGARTRSKMAFLGQLSPYENKVSLFPEDEVGFLDLDALLGEHRNSRVVYCCGPTPMLDALDARTEAWPSLSVRTERFSAASISRDDDEAFEVFAQQSGIQVTVGADESIVDALEEAGVWVATACREGVCGSCEAAVLCGIPDHRDAVLDHTRTDVMLPCVSRAQTATITLDI
jgi:ferredoxin-NADP reductase